MQRRVLPALMVTLLVASAVAVAQDGELSGVRMRVLDDISGIDAVVIELDADRGEGEVAADGEPGAERDAGDDLGRGDSVRE